MRFQAIVLVLAVAAAGCGSKKSTSTAGGSGSTTTTSSSTATSTNTGGGGSTPTFASTKNCAQLASVGRKFSQAMAAANGAGKSSITDVAAIYKALATAAPSEIRPDFETIAEAFVNYANAVKKAGYTAGKVPTTAQMATLASVAKSFSSPKLVAAEQHLSAWSAKNCSGLTTTTG
jgi:hypothetical protein